METLTYSLEQIKNIKRDGFEYVLLPEIMANLIKLGNDLGKPSGITFSNISKETNTNIQQPTLNLKSSSSAGYINNSFQSSTFSKKKGHRNTEIIDDKDWERLVAIEPIKITKFEKSNGIDVFINQLRVNLNKLTDKNYLNITNKIIEIIDSLIENKITEEEFIKVGTIIFETASQNKFYSMSYADLFSTLIGKYEIMNTIFSKNYAEYLTLFNNIEYIDSNVDYDKYCKNTKINETRKSISTFFLNLTKNKIISENSLFDIIIKLFNDVLVFINLPNKVNEVNELTENINILFDIELFNSKKNVIVFMEDNTTIMEKIILLSNAKNKQYESLSSKTRFKFLDLKDAIIKYNSSETSITNLKTTTHILKQK